jgi:GNAT superfamily N-acetyltransferase
MNILKDQVMIRDANVNDIEELAILMNELGYPTSVDEMEARFKNIVIHPEYRTLLAVVNHEIVGMAGLTKGLYYEKNGIYVRILAFVVKQSSRKLGIGKLLIKAVEQWAQEQGISIILINSGNRDERLAAHAFYQKMGYDIKSSGFVKLL